MNNSEELATRTVAIQTKGHYSWKAKRPCVTDLSKGEDGVWEIITVDGREYESRLGLDEKENPIFQD